MEQLNLGNEAVKSSKRRISSILKAPRTSMKLLGAEQEEETEEVPKPVEKKRNSRRVSFATTNNVRVFTNEAKNESPVLASIQNTHVEDRRDEKILHFVDEGSHQIKGLETLLNTPLYLSQHKENFFSEPVLHEDCVDRTMLLGDDTGYMDITQSHTITIDKDYETKEEANPGFNFKVAQPVSGDPNIASQKGLCEAKAEKKIAATDSDFSAFLASMSLPSVNAVKPQKSENEIGSIFRPANPSALELDKENHLPSFLMKQGGMGNTQQPKGLQRRRSRVSFVEDDNIELTTNHTVVIESKENAHSENPRSVPFMASSFPNISVDMELTQNQTTAIDVKVTGNLTHNVQAALDHSRSNSFSQDDNAMEMTGAFDVPLQEKRSMKAQVQSSFPKVRRKSSLNLIRPAETTDQNKAGYFQSNLSIVQTASSDDMELTGAVGATIQEKEETLFPKVSKISTFDAIGNEEIVDKNKSINTFIPPATNSDDMEMTQCQTIVFEDKLLSGNTSFSNSRKRLPLASVSRTITEEAHANIMRKGEIEKRVMMDHSKSGHTMIVQSANSDEMEITQCQTISLEGKEVRGDNTLSKSRTNVPCTSVSRTEGSDEMEMTQAFTGRVMLNSLSIYEKEKGESILIPASVTPSQPDESDCMDLTSQPSTSARYGSDEMDLTQALTGRVMLNTLSASKKEKSIFIPASVKPSQPDESDCMDLTCQPSISARDGSDEMDMTQAFTGRVMLNTLSASKKEKSVLIPASVTPSQPDESDCMELTCQPSTAWIFPPSPNKVELTGCNAVKVDSNRTWCRSAVDITATREGPYFANQTIMVVEPMEMTGVYTTPFSEQKHKTMTRRKSGARMMSLMCNLENTEADNCQTDFSSPADMEMTQCQTAVLEAENIKNATPFNKSRKSSNIVSTSFSPDVDGMEITQALTGNIVIKSFASKEEIKNEGKLLPTAQRCQMQYGSDCMELTGQASASNLAIPCVDDEMKLTGCNTIAIDSKSTLAASAGEIKVNESALWASTSVSRCTVSSEEQNEVSEAAKYATNHVFTSRHVFDLDDENLKCNNTERMSYSPVGIHVDKNCEMAHPSNVMVTEDTDMQVTKALTMAIEVKQSVLFNEGDESNIKSSCGSKIEVDDQLLIKEQSASSVQLEGSSSTDSISDSFIKEELQNAKARRRSLADLQMELNNMSRRIQDEQKLTMGSKTAPLPSCSLPEISLKERCETEVFREAASNVTPNIKEKCNSLQNEKTTPFSLKKKPFSSRISFCGIVPKLPKRATTTPNKTVTISTNDLQCFQLEKRFDALEQKSCEIVNINDEEFPEMSSEEDLSGSLENWPINNQDELDGSLPAPIKEQSLLDDVFQPDTSTSPCFKRPYPEEDHITAEQTKKAYVSDTGPDCHEAAVQWEGNFTRHAAQNPKAKTIEDTGVSECSFKYSQFDSHMDGTLDHEFDFNKKLEDGSITVNEFLNHFGINFVIHKSRPSALPDSCRAGETRTKEDLLKEKYIYHPRQRVYEQDCKNLTEIVERLKEQIPEQEKSLVNLNGALQQEICTVSKEQLKSFGSRLKERRAYFGKRSKARSHEMKGALYSELIKTTQDAKQSLISQIKETNEMMEDLDGYIDKLETELASVEAMVIGDPLDAPQTGPALKAKENDLRRLNSAVTEKEREIGELEIQLRTLESQQERLRGESSSLKSHLATLNSLNEWRLDSTDERGALFTFLHRTVHLQVNLQTPAGREWMAEDVEQNIDVSFQLQLDAKNSECHASMVHKLIALYHQSQTQWTQRYQTTQHIPKLLLDVSLMVGRLRLLGEEIHRLKRWGGLKFRILKITCVDTRVHIIFSSLKAFEKFELSLLVTPDYPFGPLHIQDFKNHMGNTRLSQIEDIISSVRPEKNYLTKVLKKIHDDLLC